MRRTITISTAVFAAIWGRRRDGEENEDAILARLLEVPSNANDSADSAPSKLVEKANGGVHDGRNGVHFPHGFRAFRYYKGREYVAVVEDGSWVRQDTGKTFRSLNQLNKSFAVGLENVWNGAWKFRSEDGSIQPLGVLRRTV